MGRASEPGKLVIANAVKLSQSISNAEDTKPLGLVPAYAPLFVPIVLVCYKIRGGRFRMPQPYERTQGDYRVTTDVGQLDLDTVERFLHKSYWAADRPRTTIARSVRHSLSFVLLCGDTQVGFARVVTDYSDFAWLCDVYVDDAHRGRELGKFLVETVLQHPELQGLRRWILATRDAHGLYAQFGFRALANPEIWMERRIINDGN